MFRVDPSSSVPIFRQIVDGLQGEIAAETYRAGDLIPSVRQQSLLLLVNPNTVQRSYETLERAGIIETRKGVGMVVTPDAPALAAQGIADIVAAGFEGTIELAQSAKLPREAVDQSYQAAWSRREQALSKERGSS